MDWTGVFVPSDIEGIRVVCGEWAEIPLCVLPKLRREPPISCRGLQ